MKNNQTATKIVTTSKRGRILLIIVSIFLATLLAVGGVFGIISAVQNARAAVKYGGVRIEDGTVRYLASYYKHLYKTALLSDGITVRDTEKFWSSEAEEGKTHGERLCEGFKDYLSSIIVANRLFLDYSSYKKADKSRVRETVEEILLYSEANGSVEEFNRLSEPYGFDYDDFLCAAELLYKAEMAQLIIYGTDGENLKNFSSECAEYLDEYSHVALMFFRTEETFLLDDAGERTYDSEGNAVMRPLTDTELALLNEKIAFLDLAIEKYEKDESGQISPETFELYLDQSDSDPDMKSTGYYFHEDAERTAEFASVFPEVVEASLDMELYEYRKVECSIGVCYIYKYDVQSGAYTNGDNVFFSDFYSDAADALFAEALYTFAPDVDFTDRFSDIDIVSIPMNSRFYIRSWS